LTKFEIGDHVIHWTYGLGTVVAIDEKHLAGITQQYYVVEIKGLQLWVPVEEAGNGSVRCLMESIQFKALFDILRMPGELLPDQYSKRRNELKERMYRSTLEGQCHVIRDLTDRSHLHALNENDFSVLNSAKTRLLDEWVLSLNSKRAHAISELEVLLTTM
jgi:CarD family transcriptional regulator